MKWTPDMRPAASQLDRLREQNAALQAELDALRARFFPAPEPAPEQEPEQPAAAYLLCLTADERVQVEMHAMHERLLRWAQAKRPDLAWQPVYRLEDLPAKSVAIYAMDVLAAGFGRRPSWSVRWWGRKRRNGRLVFLPTVEQRERFGADSERLLARIDAAMEAAGDAEEAAYHFAIVDYLAAALRVSCAAFKSGSDEWLGAADAALAKVEQIETDRRVTTERGIT